MQTRALETKDTLRVTVRAAEVLEHGDTWLLLKTSAVAATKRVISSADSEMFHQQKLAGVGDTVEGRLRIDAVSDGMLRFRYAEGAAVPENQTPMVVGTPPPPTACAVTKKKDQTVRLRTAEVEVTVYLDPYRVVVSDLKRRQLCAIGGPEKDYFNNWDSYNTGVCHTLAQPSLPIAVESFDLAPDECIYGLGEKFIKLNKVGQTLDLNATDAVAVTTPRSYKNVPLHVSTKGYGVFFNHSSLMTWWVGSMSAADVQVAAADDFLDYYVIAGDIKTVLHRYTGLTGRGEMPPRWTFGYWQSKISYQAADETLEIARKMREAGVPLDVIHLDTHWFKGDWYCDLEFDRERFPDLPAWFAEMKKLGIKISLWQLPYIPEGSQLFTDLKAVDGFVKTKEGGIFDVKVCFTPGFKGIVGVVDYTNPAAVKVHQEAFRRLFRLGAKVIKTDFGESAPLDGVYHDGTPGHRMHNLYPLLYNRALWQVTKEETGEGVVWARSAWAGNQRYPLHWGGDNSPNFHNMVPQLEGGLSFGMSGFQFWSHDIGGFCGDTQGRLLIRWMQVGMFLSHCRIHGFARRELYKFDAETLRICRDFIRLRYRLLPYIHGQAQRCIETSLPMLRALVVEYQDDPNVWNLGNEYLFGDDLLVAPICDESDRRRVYLPKGIWTDWWTRKRLRGGRWIEAKAGIETLPLYLREGAIVPLGPWMNYVDEKPTEEIELLVSRLERDGTRRFDIPINGTTIPVKYTCADGAHSITIGKTGVRITVVGLGGEIAVQPG